MVRAKVVFRTVKGDQAGAGQGEHVCCHFLSFFWFYGALERWYLIGSGTGSLLSSTTPYRRAVPATKGLDQRDWT